jgi:hypothetical protein
VNATRPVPLPRKLSAASGCACIARLIEVGCGDTITKRYLTELRIAHRLAR